MPDSLNHSAGPMHIGRPTSKLYHTTVGFTAGSSKSNIIVVADGHVYTDLHLLCELPAHQLQHGMQTDCEQPDAKIQINIHGATTSPATTLEATSDQQIIISANSTNGKFTCGRDCLAIPGTGITKSWRRTALPIHHNFCNHI